MEGKRWKFNLYSFIHTGKREIANTSGLGFALATRGFFCLTGFGLVAFWFVGFFFLLYRLHPDDFGICGNHKVVDARGRIASSEVGEWSDTFK